MFLDPDPRPPKHSTMSGFSSSQTPANLPRGTAPGRRRPLNERTKSEANQRRPSQSPEKPTVRLVKPSPAPESPAARAYDSSSSPLNILEYTVGENSSPTVREPGGIGGLKSTFWDSSGAHRVSDLIASANEAQIKNHPLKDASRPPPALQLAPSKSKWHRRSTSSGYNSESSTLRGSEFAFSQKSRKSERLSEGTTVQGTPTPSELNFRGRQDDDVPKLGSTNALHTLLEASPERPTIRAVTPSVASSPHSETRPGTGASGPSHLRYQSLPPDSQPASPIVSRSNSKRTWSTGSVALLPRDSQSSPVIRVPAQRPQNSGGSIVSSEVTLPTVSSPNFISYSPDSTRPRSRSQPLRDVSSFDSINSRLQTSQEGQQHNRHGLVTSPSWSSTQSNDTLPTLQLPRKRLRNASAQPTLGSQMSSTFLSRDSPSLADWDATHYRRQGFQSQLSTIASMSDQQSRAASHHPSHFSLGSGVTTIDDGDQTHLSGAWPLRRRQDAPVESLVSEPNSTGALESSSGDEPGDMTLGIFREESAKPPPLFTGDSTLGESTIIASGTQQPPYDSDPQLIRPMHRDGEGDEMFDTLSALQTVTLHQKRSGRSLRQRSNSTPSSHSRQQSMASYVESDRWSYGSSIFPTWAKHYYGGTAVFSSKVSIAAAFGAVDRPAFHSRHSSTWTERSIASRLGTGYSNIESNSPANSALVPRFFRPPARMGFRTPGSGTSQTSRTTRWIQSSQPTSSSEADSRPDSMAILPDPIASLHGNHPAETMPSSPPEWISSNDEPMSSPQSHLQLPQAYENQRQWDTMEYPRPMTKDETREFRFTDPHLAPSRRNVQSRLSLWPPPSFVESLDSLIHSRCNRQILLFGLGFLCPLLWMLGAVLPLPKRPLSIEELGQSLAQIGDDEVQAAMVKHEAGDSDRRWLEQRTFLKAQWWRMLNRIMSFIGLLVIGAIIALVVIATH